MTSRFINVGACRWLGSHSRQLARLLWRHRRHSARRHLGWRQAPLLHWPMVPVLHQCASPRAEGDWRAAFVVNSAEAGTFPLKANSCTWEPSADAGSSDCTGSIKSRIKLYRHARPGPTLIDVATGEINGRAHSRSVRREQCDLHIRLPRFGVARGWVAVQWLNSHMNFWTRSSRR